MHYVRKCFVSNVVIITRRMEWRIYVEIVIIFLVWFCSNNCIY